MSNIYTLMQRDFSVSEIFIQIAFQTGNPVFSED